MKNNKEIAASVFEKSHAVLTKRAETRKRIITAAATLCAAAIITTAAVLGKNAIKGGGNIPTQSASVPVQSVLSSAAESPAESAASAVSEKTYKNTVTSAPTASHDDTSHNAESRTVQSETKKNVSEGKSISSPSVSSAASSKHSITTITTITTYDDESGTNSGEEASETVSSKTTASKAVSSKTTSSKAAGSKSTSSKTTSSKTVSSSPITPRPVTESRPSEVSTDNKKTEPPTTDTEQYTETDSDALSTDDESDTEIPISDEPQTDAPRPDGPDSDIEADTDYEVSEEGKYYYTEYTDSGYYSPVQLVEYSDRVVRGTVTAIDFISMGDEYEFLKDGVSVVDDSGFPEEKQGDVITIYTLRIEEEYTPGIVPSTDEDLGRGYEEFQLFVYGGKEDFQTFDQIWALGSGKAIPIINNMPPLDLDRDYIILIKYQNGLNTLTRYDQSIFELFSDVSYGGVTAFDIIEVCRPE